MRYTILDNVRDLTVFERADARAYAVRDRRTGEIDTFTTRRAAYARVDESLDLVDLIAREGGR